MNNATRDVQPLRDKEAVPDSEPAQRAESIPQAEPSQPEPAVASDSSERLDQELSDTKDQLLRALADMDNMRKRAEREVASVRAYGISNFARDILGVADNMQRATQALNDELRAQADEAIQALLEGVELTQRELVKVLEKNGVKRIEPLGQKFDPNFHKAMKEVVEAGVPAGNVVQVIQTGYQLGDRMLRPALVAVTKDVVIPSAPVSNGEPPAPR